MDDSPPGNDQSTPELSPADLCPPERRSVPRRLVQSMLFPQTPQSQGREENGHGKAEKNSEEDGDNCGSGENEDCSGSQSKRKRKPRAKSTPTKKSSEKPKGKRSRGNTPKKNLATLLDEEAPIVIPDLRLEAKITAEENSRISAGRQIHPFFSACKTSKKNQEVTGSEGKLFASGRVRAKKEMDCAPVHVFERTEDTDILLDWRTWTFYEGTFSIDVSLESMYSSSTKEVSVECLSFDKLSVASHPSSLSVGGDEVFPEQCPTREECARTSLKSNDVNMVCYQSVEGNEGNKVNEIDSSMHTDGLRKADISQESRFSEERMKLYNLCCGNQLSNSLWTNKYQPRLAMEVCGNYESVKLLSEWLQYWHGRDPQISKDLARGISDMQSDDYICSEGDSDADDKDKKDSFKNVLLVTGPVGSGKSAAIYACAREQGFKVLEVSASESRNGALVKQRFGEALESHQLKRSRANPLCSPSKHIIKPSALANGTATQESDDAVVETIHLSDGECHNATGGSGTYYSKEVESLSQENEVKPLILFEDVDITFLEDRGLIAAIQQISETAKGPIILTSNSHGCLLPDNLDRLQIYFSPLSPENLLCHVHKICTEESADIQPFFLEQLLHFCEGDIRKAILHLQFWCQGSSTGKATNIQRAYSSLQFDIESGHQMLPKLLPWGLPSQLAELVDKEITESLSREVDVNILEAIEEEDSDEQELHHTFMLTNEIETLEAKKAAMLSRNWSADEYDELRAEHGTTQELSDHSDTPFSCFRRTSRKQHEAVLSSDSEDELVDKGCITCPDRLTEIVSLVEESHLLKDLRCDKDKSHYQCMGTESFIPVNGECKSLDVSCVPESTMVPETINNNGNYFDGEVSVCNGLDLFKANIESDVNTPVTSQHEASEFSHEEEIEDSQSEPVEAMTTGYQPMDESSCIGYRRLTKRVEKAKPLTVTDLVQNSWKKLRNSRADLAEYSRSEDQHGLQVVNLAHKMSNLISEADILLSRGQNLSIDSMDPSTIPSEESDVYNLYDACALASTTAEHGFCHYTKSIAAIGSARGFVSTADLASEMLTSMMSSRKPSQQDIRTRSSETSMPKTNILFESEIKSTLSDVLRSIVPPKSYTTLRGSAFYEYLSSLRSISRSEASRVSQGNENPRKRRRRADRHYLSAGKFMLTPEEISSLGQINTYRDISLQQDKSI